MKMKDRLIGVIDFETDPFKEHRAPLPFAAEFHSDETTEQFWGPDCVTRLVDFLLSLPSEYLIFAHNGGKFDFHFLFDFLDNPITIINGRLTRARLGNHVLQDSFAIIPVALAAHQKTVIDYDKFETEVREEHRAEILSYLHDDCVSLLKLVSAFVETFKIQLTVGSTAMKQLRERHDFERMTPDQDAYYRQFYYGGRVQCFETGTLKGPWKVYDVNSMYPFVMRSFRHPVNAQFNIGRTIPDNFDKPYFVRFIGTSINALPVRTKTGIDFPAITGEFHACSHELEVAMRYNMVTIDKVIECHVAAEHASFAEFVDHFYASKVSAKQNNDKIGELFAKFMLNSCYGKFGQDPANFKDWLIARVLDDGYLDTIEANSEGETTRLHIDDLRAFEWEPYAVNDYFQLWTRPAAIHKSAYNDVSIAASITSAARAVLLDAITKAIDPIYCDTDSIICRSLDTPHDGITLGAWKEELTVDNAAIAGKKLYALYNDGSRPLWPGKSDKTSKVVSKGGTLTLPQMLDICRDATNDGVKVTNRVPNFKYDGRREFVTRTFRRTA